VTRNRQTFDLLAADTVKRDQKVMEIFCVHALRQACVAARSQNTTDTWRRSGFVGKDSTCGCAESRSAAKDTFSVSHGYAELTQVGLREFGQRGYVNGRTCERFAILSEVGRVQPVANRVSLHSGQERFHVS
jgi:hypothetical protein